MNLDKWYDDTLMYFSMPRVRWSRKEILKFPKVVGDLLGVTDHFPWWATPRAVISLYKKDPSSYQWGFILYMVPFKNLPKHLGTTDPLGKEIIEHRLKIGK